jgi:hypothetical protein
MTENEAVEAMQFDLKIGGEIHSQVLRDAVDVAIQALEKQIPKRPIFNHNLSDTLSLFHCECGNAIKVSHDIEIMDNNNAPNYCSKCGCRLDWSDEE